MILGNWFLIEHKKAKIAGKPWYASYLSPPGVLIMGLIVLLPLLVRFV
jgi:hypothetical protein